MNFNLYQFLTSYCKNAKGATAIEYGLIAVGISLAIASTIYLFGDALNALIYEELPKALPKL